jgi:Piwi domain
MAEIALNFFRITPKEFRLLVYRRRYDEAVSHPGTSRRRLPVFEGGAGDFQVASKPAEGFDEFSCLSSANRDLTKDLLFSALARRCDEELPHAEFRRDPKEFRRRLLFLLGEHPEGRQEIWLEPYYLDVCESFGFLGDFTFSPREEYGGTKRAQQLALSLDRKFLANTNFYADRFSALQVFLRRFHGRLFPLTVCGCELHVAESLVTVPARALDRKSYVFGDGSRASSQFMGIKEHGALRLPAGEPQLCFVYRPQDRGLSQDLYRALHGDSFRTFSGFDKMFRLPLSKRNVTGVVLEGFDDEHLAAAADKVRANVGDSPAVPIVITPFAFTDDEGTKAPYWRLKHAFLSRGLPTQVVSVHLLRDTNVFKWAVSNIALGIFAKLGATPWKVMPRTERCLIIGIGQAHRRTESGIEKYFAYSVLTDSSGVYEAMRILAEAVQEQDYLIQLKATVGQIIQEYSRRFGVFVIHAPFTIRWRELEAIRGALDAAGGDGEDRHLVALKFDDHSKFFGYALANNSLVPHESSFIKLSPSDFLVWFEGLQYHNPSVRKRYGRPVHVRFDYPRMGLPEERKLDHLQDAVNLSGANWRGFNAKSLPVSVYYAKLIARHISHFQALGLPDVDFTGLPPWFL